MDALLILGGLLLMLSGLVWLVMRAFATSLLWGWGSLLPPLTLIYVLRHWRRARSAVGLLALGFIPLIVGLVLMANKDAERLQAILSLDWLKPAAQAPAELDIQLRGELNNQPFMPQHAELIDGVLSLREGQDFFARREVKIRLPRATTAPIRLDVLPEDQGELPEVEVSWLLPEQDLPEARRLSKGYTLHLDLQALPPNKLNGDFHLVLPPQYGTTLSGRLELFTDRLRYRDGHLDTAFDSQETLAHVVEDYLQRRFNSRVVQLQELPAVSFPASSVPLAVVAKVNGQEQRLDLVLEKGARGWQVKDDRYPALSLPNAVAAKPVVSEDVAVNEPAQTKPDRRQRFSLLRLLSSPQQYQNLSMRVVKLNGGTAEGRFAGLDTDGSIRLSQQHGGAGQATFTLHPDEISRVELLEP
ncbi:MFS transporter [Aquipseudomonas campi]|uniref:MFS transporter n=1 Tax=Aquipseudomonas campi TaxID=2731681 RepID=A0A6M8FHI3_9GAMM|nr:MFS transporter [Pseudomonas campi]QKE63429.1 MFS transporter [Pseudomonas campi]